MVVSEKVVKVLTPAFIQENQNAKTIEDLYENTHAIDESITYDEFNAAMDEISKRMHDDELDAEVLEEVTGGVLEWPVAVAKIASVYIAGLVALYNFGLDIGDTIYYNRHK